MKFGLRNDLVIITNYFFSTVSNKLSKMKTPFLCLIVAFLFTGVTKSLSTKDSTITNCEILQEIALLLKKIIPDNEKLSSVYHFSVDCKTHEVRGFNIHDMLDTTNYIQYRKGKCKILPNHLYHIYAWEYALSTSNLLYIDEQGKVTFFEAVNCSNRGNSLEEVEEFINKTVIDEDKKKELLKVLPFYRDFGMYMQGCGYAKILDCKQN